MATVALHPNEAPRVLAGEQHVAVDVEPDHPDAPGGERAVRRLERRGRREDALDLLTELGLVWEESGEAALAVQLLAGLLPSSADDDIDSMTVQAASCAGSWPVIATRNGSRSTSTKSARSPATKRPKRPSAKPA